MEIEILSVDKIRPADYNPRVDLEPTDPEYIKIRNSLIEFGCVEPLVVNKNNTLVGGHQRLKVMRDLGITEAPVVRVDLDEGRERALNLALNKISGVWDVQLLTNLMRDLLATPDVKLNLTGFTSSLTDALLDEIKVEFFFTDDPLTDYKPQIRKPLLCPFCGEEIVPGTEVKPE